MKILLTGASGFLGNHLLEHMGLNTNMCSILALTHHRSISSPIIHDANKIRIANLDVSNYESIYETIRNFRPDVICNCCALTSTSICESDHESAEIANTVTVKNLLESINGCHLTSSCRLIHISTDMVFDGNKPGGMYQETDDMSPVNYYGVTKAKAEQLIREYSVKYDIKACCILRSSLIYGVSSQNTTCFLDWIENSLSMHKPCSLFVDEYRSPVYVDDLCAIIQQLCQTITTNENACETYHICGQLRVSRYDFGLEYAKLCKYDPDLIIPAYSAKTVSSCQRPLDVSMSYKKAKKLLNYQPISYTDGICNIIKLREIG